MSMHSQISRTVSFARLDASLLCMSVCIFMLVSFPFVIPWHFYPDGDFLTQSISLACALMFVCFSVLRGVSVKLGLVEFFGLATVFALLALSGRQASVAFVVVLVGTLLMSSLRSLPLAEKDACFKVMMYGLAFGLSFTLFAALAQVLGVESIFSGWVFDDQNPAILSIVANIGQRNLMSQYLLVGLTASSLLVVKYRSGLLLVALISVPVGYVLALAGSRTALLCISWLLFAGLCFLGFFRKQKIMGRYSWATIICAIVLLVMQPVSEMLVPGVPTTLSRVAEGSGVRIAEWAKAWSIVQQHFPGGVGWSEYAANSFLQQLQVGNSASVDNNWTHAHNLVLHLLVELGLAAAIPFAALACLFYELVCSKRNLQWMLVILTLGMIFIHSMLEYPLWYVWGLYLFISLAGFGLNDGLVSFQLSRAMRFFFAVLMIGGIGCILLSAKGYFQLVEATSPTENQQLNLERLENIIAQSSNPALEYAANVTMIPYLRPGGGILRLCKLMEVARVMPAADKLDLIALDAFLMNDEKFAFEVLRSRYRVFPRTDDGVLISNLGRLGEEKAKTLRERIEQLKLEPFDLSKSYQLEACPEDKLLH